MQITTTLTPDPQYLYTHYHRADSARLKRASRGLLSGQYHVSVQVDHGERGVQATVTTPQATVYTVSILRNLAQCTCKDRPPQGACKHTLMVVLHMAAQPNASPTFNLKLRRTREDWQHAA